MLKAISVERFKSLENVELRLGRLNLFIGTNASGKSNFYDALRVLQGVGYGFTVGEIFDGKPRGASSIAWDGIRGGSANAVFNATTPRRGSNAARQSIRLAAQYEIGLDKYAYDIRLQPAAGLVQQESLSVNGSPIFSGENGDRNGPAIPARIYSGSAGQPQTIQLERRRPILAQFADDHSLPEEQARHVARLAGEMSDMQCLDLIPARLREYSQRQSADRLGERGENFAALVKSLLSEQGTREAYIGWLRELTPAEVEDVKVLKGALDEPLFAIREGGRTFAAPVLSDGTLRFAALTAALFQFEAPGLLLLEEIENGIHPTRLRLLVELLRQRATGGRAQLFATTHSPIVLAWLQPAEYEHTFLCARRPDGAAEIRPVNAIAAFNDVVARTPIGDLFAEGWLETAL